MAFGPTGQLLLAAAGGPVGIAFAAVGAGLNFFATRKSNKAAIKAQEDAFFDFDVPAAHAEINRARVQGSLSQIQLSRVGSFAIGRANVALRSRGEGQTFNLALSQMSAVMTESVGSLKQRMVDEVEAIQANLAQVAQARSNAASEAQQSEFGAAVSGALTGMDIGRAVTGLTDSIKHVGEMTDLEQQLGVSGLATGTISNMIQTTNNATRKAALERMYFLRTTAQDDLAYAQQLRGTLGNQMNAIWTNIFQSQQ